MEQSGVISIFIYISYLAINTMLPALYISSELLVSKIITCEFKKNLIVKVFSNKKYIWSVIVAKLAMTGDNVNTANVVVMTS